MNNLRSRSVVGRNIKALRKELGLIQSPIAESLGISVPAYSKIEAGLTDINMERLGQIAKLFKVPVIEIMTRYGENPEAGNHALIEELKQKIQGKDEEINKLNAKIIELTELRDK